MKQNKKSVIDKIAIDTGYAKKDITAVVDSFINTITTMTKNHDKVNISKFGIFEASERKARTGVNPQTGEKITIEGKWQPKFKPATAFKNLVAEG